MFDLFGKRPFSLRFKNTFLFSALLVLSCGNSVNHIEKKKEAGNVAAVSKERIKTGAENFTAYVPLLRGKNIGIITNQSGVVVYDSIYMLPDNNKATHQESYKRIQLHIVDYLLQNKISVKKIYAPEHGFRGNADAGELIVDGKDLKTDLPIISLYGDNKKPKPEQLAGIDIMVFDLQDVGARFYTYISSLHYVMEACAENNIPLIVLDRPNPNRNIVDGPILEKEHTSFVGMHPIPVLHGMTIGEYAKMINGQQWLKNGIQCPLTVIPCLNYNKAMLYGLSVKPSPNLPNDKAINLYPSLCFFEGTNVSVGRGTNKQFQIYGSPSLPKVGFNFTPMPNEGAKEPPYKGQVCFGADLTKTPHLDKLELQWLIKAYNDTGDKSKFFNPFFTKLAGTKRLQQQIVHGMSESEIRTTWQQGIDNFKIIRKLYELY